MEEFGLRVLWAAIKAAFFAFLEMLGIRQRAADDGAAEQRRINDEANRKKIDEAEARHAASGGETDDELRARAERDWLLRG